MYSQTWLEKISVELWTLIIFIHNTVDSFFHTGT